MSYARVIETQSYFVQPTQSDQYLTSWKEKKQLIVSINDIFGFYVKYMSR